MTVLHEDDRIGLLASSTTASAKRRFTAWYWRQSSSPLRMRAAEES